MVFSVQLLTADQRETLFAVRSNGRRAHRCVDVERLLALGLIVRREDRLVLTSRGYGELRMQRAA